MHLFSQYTLGIDIKNESAALVSLQSTAKGYKLAGHDIFALDPGVPIKERIGQLGRLVNNFISEYKLYEPGILISVPGKKILLREISFPLSVKENLRETMRYEVEKYVPFSATDIYFDCQITGVEKKTNTLSVLLAVAKKEDLDPYLALQTEIGAMISLETNSTILAFGVGSINGLQWKARTGVLLNQEGDMIQCNLIKGRHLLLSQILHSGDSGQDTVTMLRTFLDSIRSKLDMESSAETMYYLDDGNSPLFDSPWEGELKLAPIPLPDLVPASNLLTAYFLALKGQEQSTSLINLLPENLRRRPSRASAYISVALVVLIVFLSVGLVGNFFFQKKMISRQLNGEMTRLNREVDGLPNLKDNITSIQTRIAYLQAADQKKTFMLDIINELSILLPETTWVEKFDYSKNSVRIDGSSESASALIESLESSYLFEDVSFLTTVRKAKDGKELFTIGFTINSTGL